MSELIEVGDGFNRRFSYANVEPREIEFTSGVRVLPAEYHSSPNSYYFEYIKSHEPNTPGWRDGGHSCREIDRSDSWLSKSRSFYLDALVIHPSVFEKPNSKTRKKHPIPDGDIEDRQKDQAQTKEDSGETFTDQEFNSHSARQDLLERDPVGIFDENSSQ